MFYPADPKELQTTVDELLSRAHTEKVHGKIVGIISPHAGYRYSGFTAAHAYRSTKGETYDTIVVISPSHREYFDYISLYPGTAYRTPLSDLQVDVALRENLEDDLIQSSMMGHGSEHALEVQLPFVQRSLGSPTILPIVMGDQDKIYCEHLGKRLGTVLKGKNTLLIASTDLSHYHPYNSANALDSIFIENVSRFDPDSLIQDLANRRTEACGGGPAAAMLIASRLLGANKVRILHHCNSGDITGDRSGVVGYLSAIIVKQ
jgi:hypothetical protein